VKHEEETAVFMFGNENIADDRNICGQWKREKKLFYNPLKPIKT
jgi:hypothetical protein